MAICLLIFALNQPLTEQQIERLNTAIDGRDHREEAFVALKENLRTFDGEPGDAPLRLHPDLHAMIEQPNRYRGDLCALTGVIQQITPLHGVHDDVMEWFIRDDSGRPILIYVVQAVDQSFQALRDFQAGDNVRVYGRFYKRVEFTARDGRRRSYPAFVAAHPQHAATPTVSADAVDWLLVLVAIVVALLGCFIVLLFYVRRTRSGRAQPTLLRRAMNEPMEGDSALPEDPADALGELRRRAEAPSE